MSGQNMFSNLNLAGLSALLQARAATAGTTAATAPSANPGANQLRPPLSNLLLAAASVGVPTIASQAPSSTTTTAAAARAPDPPGCHGEEGSPPLSMATAAAVSALTGKRAAASSLMSAEHLQQVEAITKRARRMRSWDEMFGALVNYHARNGSTAVPLKYPEDPELGLWVENQRRRKFLLSPEEKYKLDLIGFQWDSFPPFLGGTSAFTNPSRTNPALDSVLACLMPMAANNTNAFGQSLAGARNILGALEQFKDQASAVAALPNNQLLAGKTEAEAAAAAATNNNNNEQQQWDLNYRKLKAFHAVHNHCDVHLHSQDLPLCVWVMQQKDLQRRGALPLEHKVKLEPLGLFAEISVPPGAAAKPIAASSATAKPNTKQAKQKNVEQSSADSGDANKKRVRTFDENFQALLEYKKIHGNVDVPQKYEKDRKLGIWVKNVRQHPQRHSQEQRDRLDSIGFKWRKLQLDEQWIDAFKQLLEYKEKYGDCNVPSRWKKCPALARWVHTQRTMYRRNKLLDDRKEKLEDAGFVWDCNAMRDDEAFHENYEKLLAFKKVRGHCNVPNKYRRDRPLGRWAAKMRDLYCYDQLDADRRKALTDIGFVWEPPVEEGAAQNGGPSSQANNTKGEGIAEDSDEGSEIDSDSEGEE